MDQAVVIGASMSGLLAAQALAKHFRLVTVVERDLCSRQASPARAFPKGGRCMCCSRMGATCWRVSSRA